MKPLGSKLKYKGRVETTLRTSIAAHIRINAKVFS
jgi:hypothetical protein